jgi:hypothetical protein
MFGKTSPRLNSSIRNSIVPVGAGMSWNVVPAHCHTSRKTNRAVYRAARSDPSHHHQGCVGGASRDAGMSAEDGDPWTVTWASLTTRAPSHRPGRAMRTPSAPRA